MVMLFTDIACQFQGRHWCSHCMHIDCSWPRMMENTCRLLDFFEFKVSEILKCVIKRNFDEQRLTSMLKKWCAGCRHRWFNEFVIQSPIKCNSTYEYCLIWDVFNISELISWNHKLLYRTVFLSLLLSIWIALLFSI